MTPPHPPGPLGAVQLAATSLYVADLDAAVAWYEDKLGLTPMAAGSDGHRYATFMMGNTLVVLEPTVAALDYPERRADSTTINLIVDRDPAEVRAELLDRGVACGPIVRSTFSSFLLRDLDGNRYYVTRPVTAEAKAGVDGATAG
jgi:catechol 2,3-dioxygenase-like lactoylglutathione lyase family enzyme